jgi:hypothetical protein
MIQQAGDTDLELLYSHGPSFPYVVIAIPAIGIQLVAQVAEFAVCHGH